MDVSVLPELEARLHKFEEVFDRWTYAKLMASQEQRQLHDAHSAEAKAIFSQLTADHEEFLRQGEQTRKQQQMEDEQLEALHIEMEALREEESRLPAVIEESRRVMEYHVAKKDNRSKLLQENETQKVQKLEEAKSMIEAQYQKYLGLTFEEIAGSSCGLRFIFTLVDAQKPEAKFEFTLSVGDGYKYYLSMCSPPVEGTESLLERLNTTDSLHEFIVAMRKKFKATTTA